jgi:uncharacterized membrane protein
MQAPSVPLSLGRCFFGAAALATGVLQLVTADFVRLVPKLPAWVPAQPVWACVVGVVLVAAGLAILSGRMARAAASLVGVMILVMVPLLWPPQFIWNPVVDRPFFRGFMWTNPLKSLALAGGAAMLARWLRDDARPLPGLVRALGRLAPAGPVLFAVFLIVCGMQHFWYRVFVDQLVPAWIPGTRLWTYFTGAALMAGGVGILVPPTARLAATLSGLMIFLWVPLLHIPRAIAGPHRANETAGVFEALALSGVALVVAATRGVPAAQGEGAGSGL